VAVPIERDIEEGDVVGSVQAGRFPFVKTENWFVILVAEQREVLRIERVQFERRCEIVFPLPHAEAAQNLNIYFLCDSYIGCDRASSVI
jgi:pre-mRNA-splicing helicase BRR2